MQLPACTCILSSASSHGSLVGMAAKRKSMPRPLLKPRASRLSWLAGASGGAAGWQVSYRNTQPGMAVPGPAGDPGAPGRAGAPRCCALHSGVPAEAVPGSAGAGHGQRAPGLDPPPSRGQPQACPSCSMLLQPPADSQRPCQPQPGDAAISMCMQYIVQTQCFIGWA